MTRQMVTTILAALVLTARGSLTMLGGPIRNRLGGARGACTAVTHRGWRRLRMVAPLFGRCGGWVTTPSRTAMIWTRPVGGVVQRRRNVGKRVAVVGAAALLVAGCGDGNGDVGEPQTLESFLGFDGDAAEMQAQAEAQQREMEEAIAACMAEEGFEYVPRDTGAVFAQLEADPRQQLSEEEFREQYGYGISTIDRSEMMVAPDPDDDPNHQIQQDMDEAEREAYQRALHGEPPEFDPDADPDDMVFEPGGCQGEAMEEVQGGQVAVFQELQSEFMELQQRIESDPRMVDAMQEWQACMREAGYDYTERFGPQQELSERMNELQQAAFEDVDPTELDPEDGPVEPDIDPDVLEELQQDELAIAAAEGECTDEHLADVEQEVRADHEGRFIEQHRDVLEQVRPED